MGEEYGETAPFLYFIDHSDPQLIEAVRRGRREEFSSFQWQDELPDPQAEETFHRSKLTHELREQNQHRILFELHKELLRCRKDHSALAHLSKEDLDVIGFEKQKLLCVRRWNGSTQAFAAFCFSDAQVSVSVGLPAGNWHKLLDSGDQRWLGTGSAIPAELNSEGEVSLTLQPKSFVLFSNHVQNKEA
jgi:maltooligosyltrehalose trehalohydrolase